MTGKRYPETHTGGNDASSFSCHSLKSMRCLLKEPTLVLLPSSLQHQAKIQALCWMLSPSLSSAMARQS